MPRYIAFLRAINVGKHIVKMGRLRALFEALELGNVETFIASGNVIFEAPVDDAQTLEQQIERHLHTSLGYQVAAFLRSPAELEAIAKHEPFPAAELQAEGNTLYISFLATPPGSAARDRLMAYRTEVDDFHIQEREVYWLCRAGFHASTFSGARLEKALGMPATLRNATTIRRLAAKYTG